MKRRAALLVAVGCLTATAVAAHYSLRPPTSDGRPTWREAQWTPSIDNWGTGKAYVCDGAGCPTEVRMFARTKVGFCNCFSGVADDDEIDRIGDIDLHGDTYKPEQPGQVASVGDLKGRKRLFQSQSHWTGTSHVLSIVVATDCKAVVATLVSSAPITPAMETAAVAVLGEKPFQQWAAAQ